MGRYAIAFSEGQDKEKIYEEVVNDLNKQTGNKVPLLLIFFGDTENFVYYSDELHEGFPNSEVIGVTTYSHLTSKGGCKYGLSAIAITSGIEVATGEILEITKCPIKYSEKITRAISKMSDTDNTVCLEFTSAFCYSEELVLDTLKRRLSPYDIPIFGASGGADDDEEINFVSLNGRIYYEGCVFAMIHNLNGRIGIFKEIAYRPSIYKFMATDVDSEERRVYELNEEPAVNVMANALKISADDLKANFHNYPLGRIMGDEIYITEPDEVYDDGSLKYNARIYNYTDLVVMEFDDYDKVIERTAKKFKKSGIKADFSIVINCVGRIKVFEMKGLLDKHKNALDEMLGDYIGMSGYGEHHKFEQNNQTMIVCVFE